MISRTRCWAADRAEEMPWRGLSIFPEAFGVMAGAQLASRLVYPRLGPRRNIAIGLVPVAASIGLMSLVGSQTSLWWMRLLMFCLGLAMGRRPHHSDRGHAGRPRGGRARHREPDRLPCRLPDRRRCRAGGRGGGADDP